VFVVAFGFPGSFGFWLGLRSWCFVMCLWGLSFGGLVRVDSLIVWLGIGCLWFYLV